MAILSVVLTMGSKGGPLSTIHLEKLAAKGAGDPSLSCGEGGADFLTFWTLGANRSLYKGKNFPAELFII